MLRPLPIGDSRTGVWHQPTTANLNWPNKIGKEQVQSGKDGKGINGASPSRTPPRQLRQAGKAQLPVDSSKPRPASAGCLATGVPLLGLQTLSQIQGKDDRPKSLAPSTPPPALYWVVYFLGQPGQRSKRPRRGTSRSELLKSCGGLRVSSGDQFQGGSKSRRGSGRGFTYIWASQAQRRDQSPAGIHHGCCI